MAEPLKILVCGDVCGKLKALFGRVANILKKNKGFEMLLCVGSFFGTSQESEEEWRAYKSGTNTVPIPTYILGPMEKLESSYFSEVSLENGGELCENVTYLGRKGILKTQSGVQIAYLSGVEKSEAPEDGCHFSQDDILALESQCQDESFKGLDILITSCWPRSVSQFASRPDGIDPDRCGSSQISRLAEQLKPRYHFAGHEGVHYERAPYRNHQVLREAAQHVTRFISLAQVGNPDKKKDTTLSQNYFFDMSNTGNRQGGGNKRYGSHGTDSSNPKRPRKGPPPLKGSCWFCLGSPQVEKHLVVSVGDDVSGVISL
ncbi:PREDICTED: CWF19-like protein 1 [Acropora digitifera]|uniref:CWF19-like protein 1 n=1 Tax=Acropora digitifera TaxID=70779 RepID=UPI00077ADDE1|nr:PREDICTED: CWF19-like protein 1 [Acropora digitifera]